MSSALEELAPGTSAGQRSSDLLTIPAFACPFVSVVLAAVLPLRVSTEPRPEPLIQALAGLTLPVALLAGFIATKLVLPPGSG